MSVGNKGKYTKFYLNKVEIWYQSQRLQVSLSTFIHLVCHWNGVKERKEIFSAQIDQAGESSK